MAILRLNHQAGGTPWRWAVTSGAGIQLQYDTSPPNNIFLPAMLVRSDYLQYEGEMRAIGNAAALKFFDRARPLDADAWYWWCIAGLTYLRGPGSWSPFFANANTGQVGIEANGTGRVNIVAPGGLWVNNVQMQVP